MGEGAQGGVVGTVGLAGGLVGNFQNGKEDVGDGVGGVVWGAAELVKLGIGIVIGGGIGDFPGAGEGDGDGASGGFFITGMGDDLEDGAHEGAAFLNSEEFVGLGWGGFFFLGA